MIRARERGMSYWPFVVTLIALLVMTYMWYEAAGDRDTNFDKAQTANAAAQNKETQRQALSNRLQDLIDTTGFVAADGAGPDKEKMDQELAAFIQNLRGVATFEFDTSKFSPTGDGGKMEEIGQGKVKVTYLPPENELSNLTWQAMPPVVLNAMRRMGADLANHVGLKGTAESAQTAQATAHSEALTQKDAAISDRQTQITSLQSSIAETTSELRDQISGLEQQRDSVTQELEEIRTQSDKRIAELQNKAAQLDGEIRTLVQRDEPFLSEGADGEVLTSTGMTAFINRGKSHFLMPGTVFEVYGRMKGGGTYHKGTIKVTSCADDGARASIIALESKSDPLVEGDLIQSKTYSPDRQMRFHLLGEFQAMGKSAIEARLEQLGAAVDEEISTLTHYLVLGTPSPGADALEGSDIYKRAQEYGTTIITEAQLRSFTRF